MNRRYFLTHTSALFVLSSAGAAFAASSGLASLSDGSFELPTEMLSAQADPAAIRAALTAAGLPSTSVRTPLNVTALTRGDDVILFDCGAGPNFMPGAGTLADALAAAGIAPEKVMHVVFTHAHPDHLWGSLDDFGTPAFPQATYHICATERDFWTASDALSKVPEERQAFVVGAQRHFKELESVLKTFRPGEEVLPGVAAFETGGHTPGHVSFEVKLGSESVLVLGDALTHPIVSFQHPDWRGGFDQEPERAIATRKRLLDRLAADKMPIIGYHLPNGGRGRVERAGLAYRFVPGL